VRAAKRFVDLGFAIAATPGTAEFFREHGIDVATVVAKIGDPSGHDAVELISSGKVDMIVNAPRGRGPRADGAHIRSAAGTHGVPLLTTAAAALAAANGMADWVRHEIRVRSLQEYHRGVSNDQLALPL
jgi:carbamoyl-phosphate synthase large subunit